MAPTQPSKFYSIERDGLTQGTLALFLECRQKAWYFLNGWSSKFPSFAITYGDIVHGILEIAYEDIRMGKLKSNPDKTRVRQYVSRIEKQWRTDNPRVDKKALEFLEMSLLIAEATMPVYFDYWHKDFKEIAWRQLESEFKIPYKEGDVNSFLRGKMDGVFGKKDLWLFETKTKSRIEEGDLIDLLPFEHQVNFYLYALRQLFKKTPRGVLYNIVRRIGLQQKQKEPIQVFSKRCVEDISKRPDFYFIRLEVSISEKEMDKYEGELHDLIRDFNAWWKGQAGQYKNTGACVNKYGRCQFLTACATGRMSVYEKRKTVFRELEDK